MGITEQTGPHPGDGTGCRLMEGNGLANRVRGSLSDDDTRMLAILGISAAVFLLALWYTVNTYPPKDDILNFYNQAEMIKDGMMPYRDFVFEFPPFSLLFFLIPSMFTSDLSVYYPLFGLEMIVSLIIAEYFIIKICRKIGVNEVLVTTVFILLCLVYFSEMVKKFDVFAMTPVIASIYFFMERRFGLAYGLIAFGTLTKIYPGLILILYVAINLLERVEHHRRSLLVGLASCIIIGLVSILPLMGAGVSFDEILSFVTFHTDRGFQVESLVGTAVQALSYLGIGDFSLVMKYGTFDVNSPICDALLPIWNAVIVASIVALFLIVSVHIRRWKDDCMVGWDGRTLIVYAALVTIVFILSNKVFSTQYMIWIFPMMVIIPAMLGNDRWALIFAAAMIVMEIFARGIVMVEIGSATYVAFAVARDVMLIAFFAYMLRSIIGDGGRPAIELRGQSTAGKCT